MEAEVPFESAPKSKRKKRFIFGAAFFLLIVLSIAFLWWLFGQPSQGTITVMPAPERADLSDPQHRRRYEGKYITFTYPHDFERRKEVEAVEFPLLERIYLSRSDIEGRKIAFTVQDNTSNSFEEYSSFRIRRNDPSVYTEERIERNGLNGVLFTKTTSVFEVGVFFHRGNQVASIVVSSPTSQNGLREEVETALDSFAWKEE